eukprot:12928994-Ditylum_brightwellii.AAC.1
MALSRDLDGIPFVGDFNYASIIGIMMYLSNNTCPNIAFAVNQCTWNTHQSTELHAKYLKQIGKCLLGTCNKRMIHKPLQDW